MVHLFLYFLNLYRHMITLLSLTMPTCVVTQQSFLLARREYHAHIVESYSKLTIILRRISYRSPPQLLGSNHSVRLYYNLNLLAAKNGLALHHKLGERATHT